MLGVFNILKPTGWTSSDVVVKVRHMLREYTGDKKIKVGHLGTLDPAGSGVLPVCFGLATKLFDYYVGMDKVYRTVFKFGKTTDTLDSYGSVIARSEKVPNLEEITTKIGMFIGNISQIPPKYSRISVGGVRACEAARKGEDIEIKARQITVYDIQILGYKDGFLSLDIHCSGGTYIRSICRDLAESLGTVAYMASIIRLKNKTFDIQNAITLEELQKDIAGNTISLQKLFEDMPKVEVKDTEARRILNGVKIKNRKVTGDYIVTIDGQIFGICCDGKDTLEVKVRLWNWLILIAKATKNYAWL